MQYIILFPSIYIINVLTLSTLISFIICKIYNYPFMNEKLRSIVEINYEFKTANDIITNITNQHIKMPTQ